MRIVLLALLPAALAACSSSRFVPWGSFRGPNGSGVPVSDRTLPERPGPNRDLAWRVDVPPGHSSPVLDSDRLYLTGVVDAKLVVLALDRLTGRELWRREVPTLSRESIHTIGSLAQASPATDGELVVSFFGSSGLHCHDRDGRPLWSVPMGPFKNDFGAASSPIIVDDLVLLQQDHDEGSFLLAVDKSTGAEVWRADRARFPRGFSTPIVWGAGGRREVVCVGTLDVVAYDLETGAEIWRVGGLGRIANMTPVVTDDGWLVVTVWAPGGDSTNRIEVDPFDEVVGAHDVDRSGTLRREEVPDGPLSVRFPQIDRDKSGEITQEEYEGMRRIFESARNGVVAIRPGGRGDVSETHVAWREERYLPYVPSPVAWRGHIFFVKNGGIFTSRDARTGAEVKTGRLSARGDFYASPVVGDGRIWLVDRDGRLVVVSARGDWEELWRVELGASVFATPAIADGRLYVRTEDTLWCFGASPGSGEVLSAVDYGAVDG